MTKQEIGKLLSQTRKDLGYTKYRVGVLADVSHDQVGFVENSSKAYTVDTLLAVVGALGLKIAFVDSGKGSVPAKVNKEPVVAQKSAKKAPVGKIKLKSVKKEAEKPASSSYLDSRRKLKQ